MQTVRNLLGGGGVPFGSAPFGLGVVAGGLPPLFVGLTQGGLVGGGSEGSVLAEPVGDAPAEEPGGVVEVGVSAEAVGEGV